MTPQNVIIGAFAFACVIIIGGGLLFGGKRHASTAREIPPEAALNDFPTPSKPEATVPDVTKPEVNKPEATKPESTKTESTKTESTKTESIKTESTKTESAEPGSTPAKSPQSEAASPDGAQPLPIVVTYEIKRKREADRIIARDPKGFWIRQIVTKIEDKKIELSKPLEQPVAVQVEFVIGHDGALRSKAVRKSSGSEEADKTAIAMLEHAQPFPPMPEGLDEQELTFNLPVRFR